MSTLTQEDWASAALEAIASGGGLAAVAVEPLAAELGATKGSFYWHFKSRAELVTAALELWEQRGTTDVIARLEGSGGSGVERLRALFTHAFRPEAMGGADMALLSRTDVPAVRTAVARVTRRRIAYIAELLDGEGLPAPVARRRAVLAYSAFLGHLQLAHASRDLLRRSVGSMTTYGDEVVAVLLAPLPSAETPKQSPEQPPGKSGRRSRVG